MLDVDPGSTDLWIGSLRHGRLCSGCIDQVVGGESGEGVVAKACGLEVEPA